METVPIAQLEQLSHARTKWLKGSITLIWPFSSSTQKAAFLLAEPDFRLRHQKGQVRVQLCGPAALAVARSKLSIGNEVLISLRDAKWVESEQGVSTPGKSVDMELRFTYAMSMKIMNDQELVNEIIIDEPEIPAELSQSPSQFLLDTIASTPLTKQSNHSESQTWTSTPAFHRKIRVSSGSSVDSPIDPFTNSEDHPRKRLRFSWGTQARWRLADLAPSPERSNDNNFWMDNDEDRMSQTEQDNDELDAASSATSPISEAELTQLVQEEQQDFRLRKRAQELAAGSSSLSTFEPYRDPTDGPRSPDFSTFIQPGFDQLPLDSDIEFPSSLSQGQIHENTDSAAIEAFTQLLHDANESLPSQPSEPFEPPNIIDPDLEAFSKQSTSRTTPHELVQQEELPRLMQQTDITNHGEEESNTTDVFPHEPSEGWNKESLITETSQAARPTSQTDSSEPAAPAVSSPPKQPSTISIGRSTNLSENAQQPSIESQPHAISFGFPTQSWKIADSAFQFGFNFAPEPQRESKDLTQISPSFTSSVQNFGQQASTFQHDTSLSHGAQLNDTFAGTDTRDWAVPQQESQANHEEEVIELNEFPASLRSEQYLQVPESSSNQDDVLLPAKNDVEAIIPSNTLKNLENSEAGIVHQQLGEEFNSASFPEEQESQLPAIFDPAIVPASPLQPTEDHWTFPDVPISEPVEPHKTTYPRIDTGSQEPHLAFSELPIEHESNESEGHTSVEILPYYPFYPEIPESQPALEYSEPTVSIPPFHSPELSYQTTVIGQTHSQSYISNEPDSNFPTFPKEPTFSRQTTAIAESIEHKFQTESLHHFEFEQTIESVEEFTSQSLDDKTLYLDTTMRNNTFVIPPPVASKSADTISASQQEEIPQSTAMTDTQSEPSTQNDIIKFIAPPHPPYPGLRTTFSYYVPLANLPTYLNKSSSYDSIVDVLAVVYRDASDPVKSDKGRKDWYTKMRVTQPGFWNQTTLVQVFRGYKDAVPKAEQGDVVLLRGFQVTAMKGGGAGMKSVDGSAWVVFKSVLKKQGKKPEWAQKEVEQAKKTEIMTGPPAEFGDEERDEAEKLKGWWEEIQALKARV